MSRASDALHGKAELSVVSRQLATLASRGSKEQFDERMQVLESLTMAWEAGKSVEIVCGDIGSIVPPPADPVEPRSKDSAILDLQPMASNSDGGADG